MFLVDKPEHRLCMYPSMCGRVILILFVSGEFCGHRIVRPCVDVLCSVPSISGTDVLWMCHFKGKFSHLYLDVHTFPLFVEVISLAS